MIILMMRHKPKKMRILRKIVKNTARIAAEKKRDDKTESATDHFNEDEAPDEGGK